jgi:GrpB-like predicted nucleotidyltransferase (UPF0157 family)
VVVVIIRAVLRARDLSALQTRTVKRMIVVDYQPDWPDRFNTIAVQLRSTLGTAAERIDHIGSTSVPGLTAKDVIDIQVTVADLREAGIWPDELLPGLHRRQRDVADDHVPPMSPATPSEWTKHYWSNREDLHVHVREEGRFNQRYALLFRDYLRADAVARESYGALKQALAEVVDGAQEPYYAIKEPACDLIIAGAEHWARQTGWVPGPSDA